MRDQIGEISEAMVREANGANFTVHVINARTRGMAAPQHNVSNHSSGTTSANLLRGFGNDPIDVTDVDSIPLSIALGTGGMYLPSSDIHQSLEKIDTLTSNFYSLGYSPEHNGDRQYHTIKVRVKRQGIRVANRVGYFDETPEDQLEQMLRLRMNFDSGFGSLPVKVQIGEAALGDRDLVVPVTTAMPLARITVVPQDQNFIGRVHVYCSIFDENGRNIGFSHKTQEVTITPQQRSGAGDFRYTMKVHVQKGAFTIVVTLRDELSNEIEVGLGRRWKSDFDLLHPKLYEQVEHALLSDRVHRLHERLVSVAQVGRAPDRSALDHAVRPAAVRQIDGRVRAVLPVGHRHRKNSSGGQTSPLMRERETGMSC